MFTKERRREGLNAQTQMVGGDVLLQAELWSLLCHHGQWLSSFHANFCMAHPFETARGQGIHTSCKRAMAVFRRPALGAN